MNMFPRKLTDVERKIIFWLLPEKIQGYRIYREMITRSQVIGEGRWGSGDLMLAEKTRGIDLTLGMSQVVAFGECVIDSSTLTISIHEPNIDDQIEVHFSGLFLLPENLDITKRWTYSYWKPGDICPATGTSVRTIYIERQNKTIYTLAISKAQRSLWLHHHDSGWNQLIPVTGFYDELLRTKNIRDAALIMNPKTFFEKCDEFSDNEYRTALIEYNNRITHKIVGLEDVVIYKEMKRKPLLARILGK